MSKQKRMIYIYEENLEFYESLDGKDGRQNKSEFINDALQDKRLVGRIDPKKPVHTDAPGAVVSAPLQSTQDALDELRQRDLERLNEARNR